mgnify:CR=1 FL=1
MKNWGAASGNSKDSEEQTAQWIQIDRGEDAEEEDISSIRLWYNMKVWPMEYELYTADESTLTAGSTDVDLNNWTSLVSVSRPSANGLVANGEGQNIADRKSTYGYNYYNEQSGTGSGCKAEEICLNVYQESKCTGSRK